MYFIALTSSIIISDIIYSTSKLTEYCLQLSSLLSSKK